MKKILIITSTISPIAVDVKHTNIEARKQETIDAINYYLNLGIFDKIIFSDNSGISLIEDLKNNLNNKGNNYWELIFELDKEFYKKFNNLKFMGEVETLEKIIKNYKFVKSDQIYKVTGRYIIKNIEYFIDNSKNLDNMFISYYPIAFNKRSVYTSFYKANINLLEDIINNSKNLYQNGYVKPIEYAFGYYLSQHKTKQKINNIKQLPQIMGVSGTNGKTINNNNIRMKISDIFMRTLGLAFTCKN